MALRNREVGYEVFGVSAVAEAESAPGSAYNFVVYRFCEVTRDRAPGRS